MADDLFEYEEARPVAEAAAILRELADGLEGGSAEFTQGDESVVVEVPDEVTLELELEHEMSEDGLGEVEVEIELEWETPPGSVDEQPDLGREPAGEAEADEAGAGEAEADEAGAGEAEADEAGAVEIEPADETEVEVGEEAMQPARLPEPAGPSVVQASRGTSLARFQLFQDRAGEWRWRLVHRNGNIIATSGEGYTRRHNAEKGLRSVVANAPDAEVELEGE